MVEISTTGDEVRLFAAALTPLLAIESIASARGLMVDIQIRGGSFPLEARNMKTEIQGNRVVRRENKEVRQASGFLSK